MKNANDERNAEVSRLRRPISAAVTNLVESMDQGTDVYDEACRVLRDEVETLCKAYDNALYALQAEGLGIPK